MQMNVSRNDTVAKKKLASAEICFSVRHRESAASVEQYTMNMTARIIAG
jgi:hypothetical protein